MNSAQTPDSSAIVQLLEIMDRLRDPEQGCPWDLKQTFETIVPHTLEEAYEVADAIERGDMVELRDELGDLLFQVVFYARLGKEQGLFDFEAVADAISHKMLRRHPHVFGDAKFDNDEALHEAWEAIKRDERAAKQVVQVDDGAPLSQMAGVTRALPALVRAEKLQRRAARVGFDWPDAGGAFDKTREEFDEVQEAIEQTKLGDDAARIEEELGDMLFAMVNVTRLLGVDAEQALRRAGDKFERRFRNMEQDLGGQGKPMSPELGLDIMEAAWERVKNQETKGK